MQVSLDGFISAPDGDLSWSVVDEELHSFIIDQDRQMGAHMYGRGVYNEMAAYWPTAAEDPAIPDFMLEYARSWNKLEKFVISTTLKEAVAGFTLISSDAVEEVRRLKMQPGRDIALAGSKLAATLINHGLVDEYLLYVHPAIVGSGTPLFHNPDHRIRLQLVETHGFQSGVVMLHYRDPEVAVEV
jgi:dihydrofolate reductase